MGMDFMDISICCNKTINTSSSMCHVTCISSITAWVPPDCVYVYVGACDNQFSILIPWMPFVPHPVTSDIFWSAFCVFHAHFWEKTHSFKICALKKRNDFRQLKRSNFRVEKCKTEENLSKFLNNMAYKTVTSMRDCVMKKVYVKHE